MAVERVEERDSKAPVDPPIIFILDGSFLLRQI